LRRFILTLVVLAAAVAVPVASASEIIDRNATNLRLTVNKRGEALLTYVAQGKPHRVLVWGAVNAAPSTPGGKQVAFKIDYTGGWKKYYLDVTALRKLQSKYHQLKQSGGSYLTSPVVKTLSAKAAYAKNYWKSSFGGSCPKYDGPTLAWFVTACKAPDGSYWAVQAWQRMLPNYGLFPSPQQAVWEVHLSHWTGDLPKLEITMDWSWRRWEHLYGTFKYLGVPVFGYASTPKGDPLDDFGRNLYVDTLDSAYGSGWKRENSFLTHKGTGVFCYSINPHAPRPAGNGPRYRATIKGPGVTPVIMWEGVSPGAYNHEADLVHNRAIASLDDNLCKPN
jgi:hypothetical protein